MEIYITIKNTTSNNYNVHVFDRFAGGWREPVESPFALAEGEVSTAFAVHTDAEGNGVISYQCEGGPSLDAIEVSADKNEVEIP